MTIDSSWLAAFKEELPHCFSPSCARHGATFIDGQIVLMQSSGMDGENSEPMTWDVYIRRNFASRVRRCLARCDVVVLAFDNYAEVPRAKAMTQAKRQRTIPPVPFSEEMELPMVVPSGSHWQGCMANRTFKTRVIELLTLRLPAFALVQPGKRLIIDFQTPVEHSFQDGRIVSTPMTDLPAMGEADVKFTRYADLFDDLLVESIDGDTIPIALVHHELCLERAGRAPRVTVYRMCIATDKAPRAPNRSKASALQEPDSSQAVTESSGSVLQDLDPNKPAPEAKRRKPKEYEYVSIMGLYQGLREVVLQSVGRVTLPQHKGHEMRMLVALVALTGTDFSRNLPLLSGKTVFGFLPNIWMSLVMVYDPATGQLRDNETVDRLVAFIYCLKYPAHTGGERQSFDRALGCMRQSKLAPRYKAILPERARVLATARNVNWVLRYWRCEDRVDPLDGAFGFRVGPRGMVQYEDC